MNERTLLGLQQSRSHLEKVEGESIFQLVQEAEARAEQHRAFVQRQEAKLRAAQLQDAIDATRLPLTSMTDAYA